MRFTSSARKVWAVLLSGALLLQGSGAAAARAGGPPEPEPCVLLKLSAPEVPVEEARRRMEGLPGLLEARLRVRWVAAVEAAPSIAGEAIPEADAAALDEITRTIAAASRLMDGVEMPEARARLADAERAARKYRLGTATAASLAEIFFRRGILFLWEGEQARGEEMFARSHALRPDFSPAPALYSPAVRAAWSRGAARPAPRAELLVQSLPSGARVEVDGAAAGTTPRRVQLPSAGPVRVRVALEGYRAEERIGQWLPGDSGMIEVALRRDPAADLPEVLPTEPEGAAAARILGEIAERSGASRVAVVILGAPEGARSVRVVAMNRGDRAPALLGEAPWPEGPEAAAGVAGTTARMLAAGGWPVREEKAGVPWYRKWWVWALLAAAAGGIAAAGLGGGGDSGSDSGSIGVTF